MRSAPYLENTPGWKYDQNGFRDFTWILNSHNIMRDALLERKPGGRFQSIDLAAMAVFVLAQQNQPLISVDRA
jgi:hypothetical protein